ncbi:hypothetical protein L0152_26770 [bacterium]|nr:hypothetical protein [bacterium]
MDGFTHKGVEGESHQRERKELLRKLDINSVEQKFLRLLDPAI